jgi:AraC-like DNA-binding protein
MATHDQSFLDGAVFLGPMLSLMGSGRRVEQLVSARLGSNRPSTAQIVAGQPFRAPRRATLELCEDLAREAGDSCFGIRAGGQRRPRTLIDFLVATAPTLRDALAVWAELHCLQYDAPLEVIERQGRVVVRQHLGSADARQFCDGLISFQVPMGRQCFGEAWAPLVVRLPYRRPAKVAPLEDVLRCPIRFAAPGLEIEISREDLDLPLRRSDPALHELLKRMAVLERERLPSPASSVAGQVRALLLEEIPRGNAAAEDVAARLGMSFRTLQRRLDQEGTSYFAVLDGARRELAMRLLRDQSRKQLDVALESGFDSASSLHRAFLRWIGETPGQFRKRVLRRDS